MLNCKRTQFCFMAMVLVALAGCGSGSGGGVDVVSAGGKVMVDDQPASGGSLTLTPVPSGEKDERPVIGAEVQSDGTFALTTYETGDGAAPGEYKATYSAGAGGAGSTDPAEMMSMMGGATTNEITVTIPDAGSDALELKFTKKKAANAAPNKLLGT